MKTAKEMFEDLGYSVLIDNEYEIYYNNIKDCRGIIFFYEDLSFCLKAPKNNKEINMPLLKAIIQQCKELEWLDEEPENETEEIDTSNYKRDKMIEEYMNQSPFPKEEY